MSARLVVLASGSGSNLQALIDACHEGRLDAEIVAVIINREGVRAFERAEAASIDARYRPLQPYRGQGPTSDMERRRYDADLAAEVHELNPDLIVQAGWMHLFSSAFLDNVSAQVLNLHPALPGCFPGRHAIDDAWAAHVEHGLDHTGVMVHLVPDEGIDDGPVVASRRVPIHADDTRVTLEARMHEAEHELLVSAVVDYLQRR